jgi:hypothetical protein
MKTVFELIEANGLTLHGDIEHFAELVRLDEREACASECDEWIKNGSALAEDIAAAIRTRSNT